ncbi:hypothetical protein D8674_017473 [Pyrus ussuriensis x Pyrus communis]|uniref:Uncharacterized protein n=1 Tax=Pyrus ussuriensis x Pyrus communis TaxID=2448454 RepID=A0A5N5HGU5_9ROSA|nr:hypothetical protein D8674_017473 [Pyrus ussuriensis x Pyrus communis]
MSNIISNHRAANRVSQTPSPTANATATIPPDMGTTSVSPVTPFGPTVSLAPTSSTSSVTHPLLSARQTHQQPQSSKEAEKCFSFRGGSTEFSESWKVVPPKHHYKLANLDANQNQYINKFALVGSLSGRATSTSIMRNMTPSAVEKGQTVLEEIMTDTLNQTLDHRKGNVHWGLGKACLLASSTSFSKQRTKEIELLTSEVTNLKEQITAHQSQLAA